jgi:hypothetical protein
VHCHIETDRYETHFERFASIWAKSEEEKEYIIENAIYLFNEISKGSGSRQEIIRHIYTSVRLARVIA